MNNHFNWICCIGLALLAGLHAQTESLGPEVSGRRAWVAAAIMPEDVANPLPILSDGKIHRLQMHLRTVNQPIPVDETGVVRAVKAMTKPDGTVVYEDLMRAVMPEGVREALIMIVPNDEEDGIRFKARVIDLSKFKKGGSLYVNLTKTKVGITIGEQKKSVKPGGMEFINPLQGLNKKGVFPVRFFYEIPKKPKAEWKLMTASRMAVYESRREICVFFHNKEIENVDFRGITFFTPKPKPRSRP